MINLPLSDETIQSLSRHELNVLKYVYEHTESVLDLSIRELSERVSYSPATVLRFCKKLGYSGFAEFKYALRAARRESGGQEAAPSHSASPGPRRAGAPAFLPSGRGFSLLVQFRGWTWVSSSSTGTSLPIMDTVTRTRFLSRSMESTIPTKPSI